MTKIQQVSRRRGTVPSLFVLVALQGQLGFFSPIEAPDIATIFRIIPERSAHACKAMELVSAGLADAETLVASRH